ILRTVDDQHASPGRAAVNRRTAPGNLHEARTGGDQVAGSAPHGRGSDPARHRHPALKRVDQHRAGTTRDCVARATYDVGAGSDRGPERRRYGSVAVAADDRVAAAVRIIVIDKGKSARAAGDAVAMAEVE